LYLVATILTHQIAVMKSNEYKLKITEDHEIQVYEWLPDDAENIKGVLQISHGMAEHAKRYKYFAAFLTKNNYAVYANDHRGHGKTAGKIENLGFFSNENGWRKVVDDLKALSLHAKEKHPNKAFFVLGHSMGSFLMRDYISNPPLKLNGAIISATAGNPGLLGKVGVFITRILLLFGSPTKQNKLMDSLSFGAYNNKFKPNRTKFDWLSRDDEQVDKYIDDPYCGFICSTLFFRDLLTGLLSVSKQSFIDLVAEDLPVLFFAGDNDPVGNFGKGVTEVRDKFKRAGVKDITLKLFSGGRHEMLNEINKDEVYVYVLDWLNKNN
jgi:alpha-beta hydrolase superfamily lysophospholipase